MRVKKKNLVVVSYIFFIDHFTKTKYVVNGVLLPQRFLCMPSSKTPAFHWSICLKFPNYHSTQSTVHQKLLKLSINSQHYSKLICQEPIILKACEALIILCSLIGMFLISLPCNSTVIIGYISQPADNALELLKAARCSTADGSGPR